MSSYSIDKRGETMRQDMRGNGTAVTLAENTYDELGRLKTSKPGSNESLKLTYDYNVRSWLTNIAGQKLTERLYYNIPFESGTPRYNGNISTAMWNLWDYYLGFNYTYDNLSRLTAGQSFLQWEDDAPGTSYGAYDTWYHYDRNGNMTALSRLEDLSLEEVDISHSGNQISRITNKGDLYPNYYSGFVSYSDGSAYAYNANGAMTSDADKGAQYAYNAFGMPSQVKVPAILGTIDYKYSATGERLEASYKWHSGLSLDPQENVNRPTYTATNSSKLRQYVSNKIYENGSLKRILLDNGYIEGGIYYFYLRDHLGNNSVVAKADGQVVQRNHYYPYGKVIGNGESWGQAAQPYKFGGKEEETMFGLELYDFHARQMDRRIPGFLGVDPLAEKYYSISPYAYCAGNPVNAIDPDGRSTWVMSNSDGTYRVVGGDLKDKDYNIYVCSIKDGQLNRGESIGVTTSITSFYDDTKNDKTGKDWGWIGSIDTKDKSGEKFLGQMFGETPSLDEYMSNATRGQMYDFKRTNGGNTQIYKNEPDFYRGLSIGSKDGKTVYTSARDIGNITAGYVAGANGMPWDASRVAFDALQTKESGRPAIEGASTRNAEYFGWRLGNANVSPFTKLSNLKKAIKNFLGF